MNIKENVNKEAAKEMVMKLVDTCYEKALDGIGLGTPSVEEMAEDYILKYDSIERASKEMIKTQVIKSTTSGVVAGLGGVAAMPVSIPANLTSVLYIQLRMIACTAHMAGYDVKNDKVQTLIYACLAGVPVKESVKKIGVKVGEKVITKAIKEIPGKAITSINKKVGFRLVTKFGETGVINLGKMVPGVGAVVNGGIDLIGTKLIGRRAYKWFIKGDFNCEDKNEKKKKSKKIIDIKERKIRKNIA